MSSRSGRRSRSRSRSRDSRKSSRKDRDRPWLRKSKSRSRSRSNSSSSSSRSRSSRRKNRRSRSRSKSPVRPVMSKDPKYVNARIFVANFASDKANSSDLQKIFKRHGKIVDILVHHNGYGFVQFALEEDARRAIEAETGTIFHGKSLKCNMAGEGRKDNDDGQKGGGGDKGRDRGGGSAPDIGMGRGGPAFPPRDDRYGRDNRDPYGPPPMGDPYMRGREMSPLPRDYRGLPPPPFGRDPRGYGDLPPDFLPLRGFRDPRDLPPPPRDPIFDDPYRRPPPPPDLYYDRYRDDPYRRDPYRMDPYRDPLRDPYGPGLLDPVPAPKKSMAVDCEIIIMSAELRHYADRVESSLKSMNLLTKLTVLREDQTIQQQVEDAARRSCLFAITINTQNHFHHSLSVNILHGTPQEHRNMPLKDAVELVGRSFEKFLTAEKEKLATQSKEKSPEERGLGGEGGGGGPPHPKDVEFLLKILVDNRPLSTEELDRLIDYLQEKKNKALGIVAKPQPMERDEMAPSPGLQQPWPQVSSQLSTPPPQPKQQSPQYQQQQPPQYQQQQQQPPYPQQREHSPSYQQQQPSASYRRQQSPPYQWSQDEPQYHQQQQQPANQRPHQQEPLYQPPQQSEKPQQQPQYPQTQQQPSQYQQTHQPQSQQQQQHQYPHTPQQQQHQYPQQVGNRPQPSYQHTPPQSSYHHQEQQQQQPPSTDTQDIQNKIMSIMNGGSSTVAASTINSLPQNTLPSHTSSLLMSTLTARPPPPPPPPQESSSPDPLTPSALGRGIAALGSSSPMLPSPVAGIQSSGAAAALPHGSYQLATSLTAGAGLRGSGGGLGSYNTASSSAPPAAAAQKGATALPLPQGVSSSSSSSSSVPGVGGIPATLINFDNPTVQKALDNLIQSGPSLLKSIQATAGHNTSLATAQQTGGFRGAGRPPHPPY